MSLLAGPGLDLRTALVGDARLVVVADTLEVDGAWLLAHMAAGALEAGRHVLLVVADPGSAESWRTALRKAVSSPAAGSPRRPPCPVERRAFHVSPCGHGIRRGVAAR